MVGLQNDIPAATAVAAAGATFGDIGFPMKSHAALAAMTCPGVNFDLIYKHAEIILTAKQLISTSPNK
jgi:hypothetical protein